MMERYIFFLNGGEFIFHSLDEFTGFVRLSRIDFSVS